MTALSPSERSIARLATVLGVPALVLAVGTLAFSPLLIFVWLPGLFIYWRVVQLAFQSAHRYESKSTWIPLGVWNLCWTIIYASEPSFVMAAYALAFVAVSVAGHIASKRAETSKMRMMSEAHPVEIELSRKLLVNEHLNAVERSILGAGARFSVLLKLVEQILAEHAYFPTHLRSDSDFNGVLIERRGETYWTHERYESGVGRFGPVRSESAVSLEAALRLKLANGHIDGVAVDFDS